MKTFKRALVFLFICRLLTTAGAAELYTLDAVLLGASESDPPELTLRLLQDNRDVVIGVAEDCLFYEVGHSLPPREMTFAEFIEAFTEGLIEFDFVEHEDDYLVTGCRNKSILTE